MSGLPARVRLEACLHLTANAAYPLLLALAVLLPPVILAAGTSSPWLALPVHAGVFLFGTLPVVLFLWAGQVAAGR